MSEEPSQSSHDLSLSESLAYDRTVMANDRSLLAFARTALTLIVTGLAFIKFFDVASAQVAGWTLATIAPLVFLLGCWRYRQMRRRYRNRAWTGK